MRTALGAIILIFLGDVLNAKEIWYRDYFYDATGSITNIRTTVLDASPVVTSVVPNTLRQGKLTVFALQGEDLYLADIIENTPGLRIVNVAFSSPGFVSVAILASPDLAFGEKALSVKTPLGNTNATFGVEPGVSARDSDLDGIPDTVEALFGYSAVDSDSDDNGIDDGVEDFDGDGLSNDLELAFGTDPRKVDSDDDGIPDGGEDLDGDGLSIVQELAIGTHPTRLDTDGDEFSDDAEILMNNNPRDPMDRPLIIGSVSALQATHTSNLENLRKLTADVSQPSAGTAGVDFVGHTNPAAIAVTRGQPVVTVTPQ